MNLCSDRRRSRSKACATFGIPIVIKGRGFMGSDKKNYKNSDNVNIKKIR